MPAGQHSPRGLVETNIRRELKDWLLRVRVSRIHLLVQCSWIDRQATEHSMPEAVMTGGGRFSEHRKLRVLCLHGFRTSGSILQKQLSKWSSSVHELLDLTFLDAPYPAKGKSDVEGYFPPPYYEWFQYNHDFTEYEGLEDTLEYITNFLKENGPFDGLLGFSQGAILSSALAGLQEKGSALVGLPPVRFVISVSGAKLIAKKFEFVYSDPIRCASIHLIGEKDWLKKPGEDLLEGYVDPVLIRHPQGHTVPRLDDHSVTRLRSFLLQEKLYSGMKEDIHEHHFEEDVVAQEIAVQS